MTAEIQGSNRKVALCHLDVTHGSRLSGWLRVGYKNQIFPASPLKLRNCCPEGCFQECPNGSIDGIIDLGWNLGSPVIFDQCQRSTNIKVVVDSALLAIEPSTHHGGGG